MWRQASAGKHAESPMTPARTDAPTASRSFSTTGAGGLPRVVATPVIDDAAVAALREGLASLRTSYGVGAVSASRTINPLIDLWGLASTVDSSVALPIETLLTVLVRRSLTTTVELAATADAVERALDGLGISADQTA